MPTYLLVSLIALIARAARGETLSAGGIRALVVGTPNPITVRFAYVDAFVTKNM